MNKKFNDRVSVRPLEVGDRYSFINLKLKDNDAKEVTKCLQGVTVKEYLLWHYDNNFENTTVILYDNDIFGFTGITDDNIFFFLTSDLNRLTSFMLGKYFNEVIDTLMEEKKVDKVHAYVDDEYDISINWAKRGGFIFEDTFEGFEVLTYYHQIGVN